jgi:predicted metalloendopeptidase
VVDDAADGERGEPAAAERAELPAAILQPPFFDPKADAAANYGSIGAVIGHEISHSFDNTGAEFDAQGRWPTGGRRKT